MQSKALEIIKSLNKKEFQRFGKFLESPFLNSNKSLVKLYKFFKRYNLKSNPDLPDKQKMFGYVYGKQKYDDSRLRKILSDMYKQLLKFLAILNTETHKPVYYRLLLNELYEKNLNKLFLLHYREAVDELENSESNMEIFYDKLWLDWQYVSFHLSRGEQHKITEKIYERSENSIFLFLCDFIITLRDIKANKTSYNVSHEPNLAGKLNEVLDMKPLFSYIKKRDFRNKHIVQSYYLIYIMNENFDDEKYFLDFKNFTEKNLEKFNRMGKVTIVSSWINYCLNKIYLSGKTEFENSLYEAYKNYLEAGLYLEHPYFPAKVFLNIIDNFSVLDKLDELKAFFTKNINGINPDQQANISAFCIAYIRYAEGSHAEALELLSRIKSNTVDINSRFRRLVIKILFDMGNYERTGEELKNYSRYIRENRYISEIHRKNSEGFFKNLGKLLKFKINKYDSDSLAIFRKKITVGKYYYEKKWLLRRLDQIR